MKKKFLRIALFICAATSLTVLAAAFNTIEYEVGDGVLYFDTESGTVWAGYGVLTEVEIPSEIRGVSVTAIKDNGFFRNDDLTAITIPGSVTTIGQYAFTGTKLTEFVIPDNVTSVGKWAFLECADLTTVRLGSSLSSISDSMFESCGSLTAVVIPDSVTSIGPLAFSHCSSLAELTIGNRVTSIGQTAFSHCAGLRTVTIPDSVTTIDWSAFAHCTGLTTVTIGKNVASIGNYAFEDCPSLTDVYYGGTEAQWNAIEIGWDNDALTNARIHYSGTGGPASGSAFTLAAPVTSGGAAITAANLRNLTSVSVPVQYSGTAARTVSVAVAFYDGNGRFTGFGIASANVSSGGTNVTVPISVVTDAATVKTFVLDTGLALPCGAGTYAIPAA